MADNIVPPITDPQSHTNAQAWEHVGSIDNAPVAGDSGQDNQRVLYRQNPSGSQRGDQSITGSQTVRDPSSNNPVISTSGVNQNQTFTNPTINKSVIINGKQSDGTYGMRILDNDGTPVAQFGTFPDGSVALKIAQPGIDVTNATNSQLYINSNQNAFKIAKIVTGTYLFTTTDESNLYALFSFSHDLGFKPTVIGSVYITADSLSRQLPFTRITAQSYFNLTAGDAAIMIQSVTNSVINCSVAIYNAAGLSWLLSNETLSFKFYCLQETIISAT